MKVPATHDFRVGPKVLVLATCHPHLSRIVPLSVVHTTHGLAKRGALARGSGGGDTAKKGGKDLDCPGWKEDDLVGLASA